MQGEPVYGVKDEAEAHVGSGVVDVYDQVHGLFASFGPNLSVQLLSSPQFIGG